MKTTCLIFYSVCLLACSTKTKTEKQNVTVKNNDAVITRTDTTKQLPLVTEIGQLNEDTCSIHWYGGGLFSVCFEKGKVYFFFTPQCIYRYKTKLENDRLIFLWEYTVDCVFDRGLEKDYGLKKPAVGAPFGEFALLNDTTIQVKYYYSGWVKKVNDQAKYVDTLFPTILKTKRK